MKMNWQEELLLDLVPPTELYNGLSEDKTSFFAMNGNTYIMDGAKFLIYDGTTVKEVEPYIPTLFVSKEPTGGGEPLEDINLLGAGFKDSFSADGTAKDFVLSQKGLDATAVKVEVDAVKVTTGFTVDRVNGKVTFTTAPAKGTNNVIITAYKTHTGFPERIKKCTFNTLFGGANDSRVFISGNPDMPDYIWRSGIEDPTYWPENGFYKYHQHVRGFSKQYDYLLVHLANGYRVINYEINNNGFATFPSRPINDQVGTLAPQSIQIVENNPVSLSKRGVYMVTNTNVRDERNVQHLSEAIDMKLLSESDLDKAISVDFDKKYWLAVNGNVYVFDYSIGEWFLYDNIHANCFMEINGDLYFGSSQDGLLYRFKKETDERPYNDDESPINAYWKSKYLTFGAHEMRKLVEKVFYSIKPATRTSADLYYVTDKKYSELVKTARMDLLDFGNMDFTNFSFLTSTFPSETMTKIKAKKITHFQLVLENNKQDESLGVLSLGIKYRNQSYVK